MTGLESAGLQDWTPEMHDINFVLHDKRPFFQATDVAFMHFRG